jgi:hypothetical protein
MGRLGASFEVLQFCGPDQHRQWTFAPVDQEALSGRCAGYQLREAALGTGYIDALHNDCTSFQLVKMTHLRPW